MEEFEILCPHCSCLLIIEQINCGIFRHGIYKNDFVQIDPHLPKNKCDELIEKNLIYGCGKPFKIEQNNDVLIAIECDYI